MQYKIIKKDLFSVSDDYYLAHCISADFGMDKGIVVEFNKRFDMKRILKRKYPYMLDEWDSDSPHATCILEGRVFNLITKRNYWLKPTYQTLSNSLVTMRDLALKHDVVKIAMPLIGCGLDRLQWSKVSSIICDVFKNTDIEILICKKEH